MRTKGILGALAAISLGATALLGDVEMFGSSQTQLVQQDRPVINRGDEIMLLKQRISRLNERVDGLTTVIEGLNVTINDLRKEQSSSSKMAQAKIDKLDSECLKREPTSNQNPPVESKKITKSYDKPHPKKEETQSQELASNSNAKLYSEGVRLFQKDRYKEATRRFELAQSRGYKPAASNYYLGEISYYSKNYSDAIFYFKKSAGLYDKASYIDTLLLHTAVSLEKTGDISQAKLFYQTIIDGYPEKKSAKIARKKLNNL